MASKILGRSSLLHSEVHAALLLLGAALFAGGCEEGVNPPSDAGLFTDGSFASASVQGYVWDPEAYWYALFLCGAPPPNGTCTSPPVVVADTPLYSMAAVAGASVGLFDPLNPFQTHALQYVAAEPSAIDGGYFITGIPLRESPPFFTIATPPTTPISVDGGASMIPPAGYLPTFTAKPIATARSTECLSQAADLATDSGVLEAVAKFRTFTGMPTAVADLIDLTKFGSVIVWWLWMPGLPSLKLPATGVQMTADLGTTYNIAWAPPGVGPPYQSHRGFFVSTTPLTDPNSHQPAITVTVMPPMGGAPPMVTFTTTDPVTDAASGRPWTFPALPPTQFSSGLITQGELQGSSPNASPAPDWVCLP